MAALALINKMSGMRETGSKATYRAKLRPDCKTYSAAISCLGKAGQWLQADALFCKMDAEGIESQPSPYGLI
jgi:pentatricopeptide repeat protein